MGCVWTLNCLWKGFRRSEPFMKTVVRVILASMASALAFAGSKVASDMPARTPTGMVEVIVQYKASPRTLLPQLRSVGEIRRAFQTIPAVHMNVPVSRLGALAADPRVSYISPNRAMTGTLDITTESVHANQLWPSGWDGSGI